MSTVVLKPREYTKTFILEAIQCASGVEESADRMLLLPRGCLTASVLLASLREVSCYVPRHSGDNIQSHRGRLAECIIRSAIEKEASNVLRSTKGVKQGTSEPKCFHGPVMTAYQQWRSLACSLWSFTNIAAILYTALLHVPVVSQQNELFSSLHTCKLSLFMKGIGLQGGGPSLELDPPPLWGNSEHRSGLCPLLKTRLHCCIL